DSIPRRSPGAAAHGAGSASWRVPHARQGARSSFSCLTRQGLEGLDQAAGDEAADGAGDGAERDAEAGASGESARGVLGFEAVRGLRLSSPPHGQLLLTPAISVRPLPTSAVSVRSLLPPLVSVPTETSEPAAS